MANPVGRPTKYTKETLDKVRDYIKNYERCGDVVPTISGLAVELDIRRETLHAWAREEGKEEFSHMLAVLLAKQQRLLISKGLSSQYNSNITKLMLAQHGMHDKVDQDIKSDGEKLAGITFVPANTD